MTPEQIWTAGLFLGIALGVPIGILLSAATRPVVNAVYAAWHRDHGGR